MYAAPAAYLHPLADAHQVKYILGAAAHAARAAEGSRRRGAAELPLPTFSTDPNARSSGAAGFRSSGLDSRESRSVVVEAVRPGYAEVGACASFLVGV